MLAECPWCWPRPPRSAWHLSRQAPSTQTLSFYRVLIQIKWIWIRTHRLIVPQISCSVLFWQTMLVVMLGSIGNNIWKDDIILSFIETYIAYLQTDKLFANIVAILSNLWLMTGNLKLRILIRVVVQPGDPIQVFTFIQTCNIKKNKMKFYPAGEWQAYGLLNQF